MLPLREVANGDLGTIRVHVPFPMCDLSHIHGKLGSFSQDPSTFIREFQALTIAFDLTWPDIHVVLTTCCIMKKRPGSRPWLRPGQIMHTPEILMTTERGQRQSQGQTQDGDTRQMKMGQQEGSLGEITCLLEGMKKAIIKPVNYNKLREVTQERPENPALFQAR